MRQISIHTESTSFHLVRYPLVAIVAQNRLKHQVAITIAIYSNQLWSRLVKLPVGRIVWNGQNSSYDTYVDRIDIVGYAQAMPVSLAVQLPTVRLPLQRLLSCNSVSLRYRLTQTVRATLSRHECSPSSGNKSARNANRSWRRQSVMPRTPVSTANYAAEAIAGS